MNKLLLALVILIAGCSKQQSTIDNSNLKSVTGAFGYNLGDKVANDTEDNVVVHDMPPFQMVSFDKTSDGTICRIVGSGFVEKYELDDVKKRLISVLTEKYGAREKIGAEKYAKLGESEGYYFGTTNRVAHLWIDTSDPKAFLNLEYYDADLKEIFSKEQRAKDKSDDEIKKAAMSKGL